MPYALGGEERLEDLLDQVGWDADAGVRDTNDGEVAEPRRVCADRRDLLHGLDPDDETTSILHGIPRNWRPC